MEHCELTRTVSGCVDEWSGCIHMRSSPQPMQYRLAVSICGLLGQSHPYCHIRNFTHPLPAYGNNLIVCPASHRIALSLFLFTQIYTIIDSAHISTLISVLFTFLYTDLHYFEIITSVGECPMCR